jgi:hypothetical protein
MKLLLDLLAILIVTVVVLSFLIGLIYNFVVDPSIRVFIGGLVFGIIVPVLAVIRVSELISGTKKLGKW